MIAFAALRRLLLDHERGQRAATAFAARLREAREAVGMTQRQLATAAGLSQKYVWHLESGQRVPSGEAMRAIVKAFGQAV